MRIKHMTRWLLFAVFLAGCAGTGEPRNAVINPPAATAEVSPVSTLVPATAEAAAQPAPTAAVDGGFANDESVRPSATIAAQTPRAPSPAATATPAAARWSTDPHPLQIEVMRQQAYPGSPLTVEQTLEPGSNYSRTIVSYRSDGYKIYALMTIPHGTKPVSGWPAIIFNHGYVDPAVYRATTRYVAYVDAIARSGYIVFMPDYRGWGTSEGGMVVGGGYGAPDLTVDVLNALALLKAHPDVDVNRIGMWGHSMGGQLTLRAMVVAQDIKAGVVWGSVVAPYPDIIALWNNFGPPSELNQRDRLWVEDFSSWVKDFSDQYGTPEENPDFWATISPNTYLADLSGPIELHHSTTDEMVPLAWAETLVEELKAVDRQPFEFYTYPGDNHNISANFSVAMQRTLAFFDQYVKNQP